MTLRHAICAWMLWAGSGLAPALAQSLPANHPAQRRHSAALEALWRGRAGELGARAFDDLVRRPGPPLFWHSADDWLPLLGQAGTGDAWARGGEWLYGLEPQCTPGWWGRANAGVGAQGPLPEDPAQRTVELRLYPRVGAAVPEVPVELQVVLTFADGSEQVARTQTIEPGAWRRPGFTLYVERAALAAAAGWSVRLKDVPEARRTLTLPPVGFDWETRFETLLARDLEWSEPARRIIDELFLWRERGARPPHGTSPGALIAALEAEAAGQSVAGVPWPLDEPERGPWVLEPAGEEGPRGALIWVAARDGAPDEIFAGELGERLAAFAERSGWAVIAVSGLNLEALEPWLAERGLGTEHDVLCVPRGQASVMAAFWSMKLGAAGSRIEVAREVRRLPLAPGSDGLPRLWAPGLERPDGAFDAVGGILPCFSDPRWMGPVEAWWEHRTSAGADR